MTNWPVPSALVLLLLVDTALTPRVCSASETEFAQKPILKTENIIEKPAWVKIDLPEDLKSAPDWVLWQQAVANRLDSPSYEKYRDHIFCDYDSNCKVEFSLNKEGVVSDFQIKSKSLSPSFDLLVEGIVRHLALPTLIQFPVNSKIERIQLTGDFFLPRKLRFPWAILYERTIHTTDVP